MSEKVQIRGDVGAAVNAEGGATVHIHVAAGAVVDPAPNTLQPHHWAKLDALIKDIGQYNPSAGVSMPQQLRQRFGGNSGAIPVDRYPDAWHFLTDQLQQAREAPERKQLLHDILKTLNDRGTKTLVKGWSEERFGTSFYKTLELDDLRQVHRYALDTWLTPPSIAPADDGSSGVEEPIEASGLQEESIPSDRARQCPQCERATWLHNRLCRWCDFDLTRHDYRVGALSKVERIKKVMSVLAVFGVLAVGITLLALEGIPKVIGTLLSFLLFAGIGKGLERIVELRQEASLK